MIACDMARAPLTAMMAVPRMPTTSAIALPDSMRGQAFGLALGGMQLGQGAAMVIAGALAQRLGLPPVICRRRSRRRGGGRTGLTQ